MQRIRDTFRRRGGNNSNNNNNNNNNEQRQSSSLIINNTTTSTTTTTSSSSEYNHHQNQNHNTQSILEQQAKAEASRNRNRKMLIQQQQQLQHQQQQKKLFKKQNNGSSGNLTYTLDDDATRFQHHHHLAFRSTNSTPTHYNNMSLSSTSLHQQHHQHQQHHHHHHHNDKNKRHQQQHHQSSSSLSPSQQQNSSSSPTHSFDDLICNNSAGAINNWNNNNNNAGGGAAAAVDQTPASFSTSSPPSPLKLKKSLINHFNFDNFNYNDQSINDQSIDDIDLNKTMCLNNNNIEDDDVGNNQQQHHQQQQQQQQSSLLQIPQNKTRSASFDECGSIGGGSLGIPQDSRNVRSKSFDNSSNQINNQNNNQQSSVINQSINRSATTTSNKRSDSNVSNQSTTSASTTNVYTFLDVPKWKLLIRRSSATTSSNQQQQQQNLQQHQQQNQQQQQQQPNQQQSSDYSQLSLMCKDCAHCQFMLELQQQQQQQQRLQTVDELPKIDQSDQSIDDSSDQSTHSGDSNEKITNQESERRELNRTESNTTTGQLEAMDEFDVDEFIEPIDGLPIVTLCPPELTATSSTDNDNDYYTGDDCNDQQQNYCNGIINEEDDDNGDNGSGITVISLEVPILGQNQSSSKQSRSASVDSPYLLQVPKRNDIEVGEGPPKARSKSVDIVLPTSPGGPYLLIPPRHPPTTTKKTVQGEIKIQAENGETRVLRSAPDWTESAILGDHIWVSTSTSGSDLCYVGENKCTKIGPRLCCPACKVTAHTGCISILIDNMKFQCKPTFKDGVRQYREQTFVKHHWVHRRHEKGRCKHCGKSFQSKLSFGNKEVVAVSCSWCKSSYHNREPCFTKTMLEDNCDFGIYRRFIVPSSWIVKLPRKGSFKSSIRRNHRNKRLSSKKRSSTTKSSPAATTTNENQNKIKSAPPTDQTTNNVITIPTTTIVDDFYPPHHKTTTTTTAKLIVKPLPPPLTTTPSNGINIQSPPPSSNLKIKSTLPIPPPPPSSTTTTTVMSRESSSFLSTNNSSSSLTCSQITLPPPPPPPPSSSSSLLSTSSSLSSSSSSSSSSLQSKPQQQSNLPILNSINSSSTLSNNNGDNNNNNNEEELVKNCDESNNLELPIVNNQNNGMEDDFNQSIEPMKKSTPTPIVYTSVQTNHPKPRHRRHSHANVTTASTTNSSNNLQTTNPVQVVNNRVEQYLQHVHRSFVIKPIPSANLRPLLVFINPKSGGNQGAKLMQKFQWHLNPRQVFDLSQGGPRLGLDLYKKVHNLRILACGGDGTAGWVLSAIDEIAIQPPPPIAVLPLGTGNDLARSFGWGGSYTDEPIAKILCNIQDGQVSQLDRWNLKVQPNTNITQSQSQSQQQQQQQQQQLSDENKEAKQELPLNVVNNYFSIGVDAHIALSFHEAREAHPERFNSRLRNKMFYGQAGGKDLLQRKWKDLCNYVNLQCDGKDFTGRLKELKVHSVLFLNIPSYGGGTRPWPTSSTTSTSNLQTPKTDDGYIEVIGLTTYQLPLLQAGGHGTVITQCREAKIVTSRTIPMQVDGEPCRLLPSTINLELRNKANVVANTKTFEHKRQMPALEKITLKIRKLNLNDYETYHYDKDKLKEVSNVLGSITIDQIMELSSVRTRINEMMKEKGLRRPSSDLTNNNTTINSNQLSLLIKDSQQTIYENLPSSPPPIINNSSTIKFVSNDWCFVDSVTAERFFRIDRAQEELYYVVDICHEDLFILDPQFEDKDDLDLFTSEEMMAKVVAVGGVSSASPTPSPSPLQHNNDNNNIDNDNNNNNEQTFNYQKDQFNNDDDDKLIKSNNNCNDNGNMEPYYKQMCKLDHLNNLDTNRLSASLNQENGNPLLSPVSSIDSPPKSPLRRHKMLSSQFSSPHYNNESKTINRRKLLNQLMLAARNGDVSLLKHLHHKGVNLMLIDDKGMSALHYAVICNQEEAVAFLANAFTKEMLNLMEPESGHTALHKAIIGDKRNICLTLVLRGARLDLCDNNGQNIEQLGRNLGHHDLLKTLLHVTQACNRETNV